jgi:hypothetical protein
MDHAALQDFILADPELSALAGAPGPNGDYPESQDQTIVDVLRSRTVPVYGPISRADFGVWAASTGVRAVIQDHADNQASPLRSSALTLLDFLRGGLAPSLDFGRPENLAMLEAWVQAGAISTGEQGQKEALLALATQQISVAEQQGFAGLGNLDVARALGRHGVEGWPQ